MQILHIKYHLIMLQKDATNIIYIIISSFLPIDGKFQGGLRTPFKLNIKLYLYYPIKMIHPVDNFIDQIP